MFDKRFTAHIKKVQIKRSAPDKGGDLSFDITLSAILTDDMRESLGGNIDDIFNTELNIDNVKISEAAEGLMMDIWNETADGTFISYFALSNLSTKKYKLMREADTHHIYFETTLKSQAVTEADCTKLISFLGTDATLSLGYAQASLEV